MLRLIALPAAFISAGCATVEQTPTPQAAFFAALQSLCGKAYAGRVVSTDPADREMASQPLLMHVRNCSDDEIRIPFHVGGNRSRTWVVTRTPTGLLLKHDHRHADGSADAVTNYGGEARSLGTARRQEFPADDYTLALFRRQQMIPNLQNVWAVEVDPGRIFAYELSRPARRFRVEFDLTRPVPPPPPPWGAR